MIMSPEKVNVNWENNIKSGEEVVGCDAEKLMAGPKMFMFCSIAHVL